MRRIAMTAALVAVLVGFLALAAPGARAQKGPSAAPLQPSFGDLMQMLVQPRHLKLGLAGQAGNWPLAQYALLELRQAFGTVAREYPMFRSQPIGVTVGAIFDDPFKTTGAAIDARDAKAFAEGYARITTGCNACHSALDHPFVVIKVPDASAFPNQDFKPAK